MGRSRLTQPPGTVPTATDGHLPVGADLRRFNNTIPQLTRTTGSKFGESLESCLSIADKPINDHCFIPWRRKQGIEMTVLARLVGKLAAMTVISVVTFVYFQACRSRGVSYQNTLLKIAKSMHCSRSVVVRRLSNSQWLCDRLELYGYSLTELGMDSTTASNLIGGSNSEAVEG